MTALLAQLDTARLWAIRGLAAYLAAVVTIGLPAAVLLGRAIRLRDQQWPVERHQHPPTDLEDHHR